MADVTKIQWTTSMFNPWRGCQRVSEGCRFCYAEATAKRNPGVLGEWGPQGTRVFAAESYWQQAWKWEKAAARSGEPHRVFCCSLADVFEDWPGQLVDHEGNKLWVSTDSYRIIEKDDGAPGFAYNHRPCTLDDARARLFRLIEQTPHLTWQLLTKRPENMLKMTYDAWCKPVPGHVSQNAGDGRHWHWPANVWAMTTVENQEAADRRIPELLKVPARVRGLSVEPLLGPVDLQRWLDPVQQLFACKHCGEEFASGEADRNGKHPYCGGDGDLIGQTEPENPLHWVIVGGESGPHARPCHVAWVRGLVRQCREADVACFVKQLGADICGDDEPRPLRPDRRTSYALGTWLTQDPKGGDPAEWPEDLRVREFPAVESLS